MARLPSDHAAERERFVEDLLAIMTQEEKIGQLVLQPSPDAGDSGDVRHIRDQLRRGQLCGLLENGSPGDLANLQRIAIEETRLGIPLLVAAPVARGTELVMPSPFALASTWEPSLADRSARIVSSEARHTGRNWLLGPDVALSVSPKDKYLASSWGASARLAQSLASATVRGLEHRDEGGGSALACLRVDDPSWTGRHSARRLDEKLRLVAGVLREASPASVALDAVTQDAFDLRNVPEDPKFAVGGPGGFEGIDLAEWAEIARLAGQDLGEAPYVGLSVGAVDAAVKDGRIPTLMLDDAVRRVLGAKYDLGLFRSEGPVEDAQPAPPKQRGRTVALDAARHAIVLLRNDPALLPLTVDSGEILIVGLAAGDRRLPMGDSEAEGTSLIDGLEALGLAHKYVPGLALRQDRRAGSADRLVNADRMAIGMASEAARRSRTVIVALGEIRELGEAQRTLLESLRAANANIILVTLGTYPLDPEVSGAKLPCVLHAGQLGTMSGHALAEVLTGEFAPRGRLPIALADKGTAGLSLGHGLGYSDFALGETALELSHDRLVLSTVLHNVGEREGTETVQLYVRRPEGRGYGPRELADFQRLSLVAGESRRLLFEIGGNHLGEFARDGSFAIRPGTYELGVGLSEERASPLEIAVPQAVAEAMARARSGEPLPGLFGKLRSVG
ncbi:glycoside hydrolase family 3 C-terminal domain-containing protein [Qipengyuania flava]|uniref:glycoside hydrolase family 3 C-terminal domain-containing protein n=1 Tax=Qipengyuania flava TaxID=192812 RepID=UPI001C62E844|nr:glycoside hydrolase family 3 C-terminal domain-containing protein [Qipengyuania flava]QYJ07766.1 glycoside hydrolase family 3 C-terminal domain-containing protein [Qipengyuania flava]